MMTSLAQQAIEEMGKLSAREQDRLAVQILELIADLRIQTDKIDEADEAVLDAFVNDDRSIDFSTLNATAITVRLDELYAENRYQ
jgi:hypothetical protein